jgi:UMF1 family MFS transporter
MAVRIAILTAALWWAGFTLFTVKYLHEAGQPMVLPEKYKSWPKLPAYTAIGLSRTIQTTRRVARFRHLVLFLAAFMLYDDGIQTVILMASIYGIEELRLSNTEIMVTLLVIQVIATFGALIFSRLASRIGTKQAIMLSLVLWSGVVSYAYFITTAAEFFTLGVVVGFVLGGTQALSRSFYGSMVPEEASAEFYGFYTVFSKFSALWGPLIFGVIRQWAGSSKLAIVSLIVFFAAGLVLLALVDERKARTAKQEGAFA